MHWLPYSNPPTQQLNWDWLRDYGVSLSIRREDLNHPCVSGNKYWKLKYNLAQALLHPGQPVLTFGGAYSNHLLAIAHACHFYQIKCVGIVRGERPSVPNARLQKMTTLGMHLEFVSRDTYRVKTSQEFLTELRLQFNNPFIIPEGGTNALAVEGCSEWAAEILKTDFDYLLLAVGTGGSMAGLVQGFAGNRNIIGIPVLKGGAFLTSEIERLIGAGFSNWQLLTDYHFGGYAKSTPALNNFIESMQHEGLPLEPVYSGKMFWATCDLIKKGFFKPGSRILVVHTGGVL